MTKKSALTIINWCLYAIVALVPLIFVQRMMNPFVIPKITLFQSLAEIIIFLWIGLAIFYKEYRPSFMFAPLKIARHKNSEIQEIKSPQARFLAGPLSASLFVLFFLLTLSSIFGVDPQLSFWSYEERAVGIVALWHFFLLFLSLVSLRKEIKWKNIWLVSIATSGLISLLTLFAFTGSFLDKFFLNQGWVRPGGSFGNPTFLAGYVLFNVFLSLWFLKNKSRGLWVNIVSWVSFVSGILVIFKTQTRGDIIGLFIGFLFLSFLFAINKFKNFEFQKSVVKNIWLWILVLIFVFGGTFMLTRRASFWNNVPGLQRLASTSLVGGELSYRLMAWEGGFRGFMEKPILGYGWENFNTAFSRHYNPNLLGTNFGETNWDKPHNIFLEYLVTGGVLGFLAYLSVFIFLFYELIKSKEDFYFKTIFGSMIVAYVIQNSVIFDTIGTYLMFFLVLAFISTKYLDSKEIQSISVSQEPKFSPGVMGLCFLVALVPVYFLNVRAALAIHYEYGGPNYFLNQNPKDSLISFQKSLDTQSPYRDYAVLNMVDVVRQAYQQGVAYPNLKDLIPQIDFETRKVLSRHPQNFFLYAKFADFKNTFYEFNPKYLDEAEALAWKALELSPNRQQVYYVLAKTNILRQKYDVAKNMFQKAVDLNPRAGDPHFYLGLLAYQTGNSEMGDNEIALAKKLGREPKNVTEAVALATILGDLERRYDESVKYYKLAYEMKKGEQTYLISQEIELKLALAYYFNNQLDEAKKTFEHLKGQGVDFTTSPSYEDLKPVFRSLGLDY